MIHGDDQGLVMPPKAAPTQVIIIPIGNEGELLKTAENLKLDLENNGVRVKLDLRSEYTLGYKRNEHELKGVPIRLELGQKELENKIASLSIRYNAEKQQVSLDNVATEIPILLEKIQKAMYDKAQKMQQDLTSVVNTYEEFKQIMNTKRGFLKAFWCEDKDCEAKIKEETKATTRCLPLDAQEESGKCVQCNANAKYRWLFAQAY
jgi:prolyl-tRNA synthetase